MTALALPNKTFMSSIFYLDLFIQLYDAWDPRIITEFTTTTSKNINHPRQPAGNDQLPNSTFQTLRAGIG